MEKYGEDNAKYLMETMGDWLKHYHRLCLIDTGVGPRETYRKICADQIKDKGWVYEEIIGNTVLITKLLSGDWDQQEFLILLPGEKIAASNDSNVVCADTGNSL